MIGKKQPCVDRIYISYVYQVSRRGLIQQLAVLNRCSLPVQDRVLSLFTYMTILQSNSILQCLVSLHFTMLQYYSILQCFSLFYSTILQSYSTLQCLVLFHITMLWSYSILQGFSLIPYYNVLVLFNITMLQSLSANLYLPLLILQCCSLFFKKALFKQKHVLPQHSVL